MKFTPKKFMLKSILTAAVLGVAASVANAAIVVPPSLNPGDKYHLAFVSSTSRNALSSDIADYNAFVQSAADAAGFGITEGVTWYVLASTSAVDARDNAVVGAATPVYLLNGTTKVADGFADFWDGSLDNVLNLKEDGVTSYGGGTRVFTGSDEIGGAKSSFGEWLGNGGNTAAGDPTSITRYMDASGTPSGSAVLPFYALSQELTVAPEPGTMGLLGLASGALLLRRRRKN